jgi:dimethylaniline monooxygenase (N-oxide forming)
MCFDTNPRTIQLNSATGQYSGYEHKVQIAHLEFNRSEAVDISCEMIMAVLDLIIVGAGRNTFEIVRKVAHKDGLGPFGLIAAYTWLEINRFDKVLILESSSELGYVGNSQSPLFLTGFPSYFYQSNHFQRRLVQIQDLPYNNDTVTLGYARVFVFPHAGFATQKGVIRLFPASHVDSYLENFLEHKIFAGKTVKDRIVFNSAVKCITKVQKLWHVGTDGEESFTCKKLIMATGLTSTPNLPSFTNKGFRSPVIQSRDLASQTQLNPNLHYHIN